MYEYAEDVISTMKVSVNKNRDGNIQQEGEVIAGVENFTFEIIEEVERSKLNERESYWQEYFHAKDFGYSIK